MKKCYALILIISFFSLLLLPFAVEYMTECKDANTALIENRNIAPMPNKFKWRKISGELEAFYNDRIPFRNHLLNWCSAIQSTLFPFPKGNAIAGKNDFFFYQPQSWENTIEQFRGNQKWRCYDLKKRHQYLIELNNFLTSQNIRFLMVIAPNKVQIYPEYLPERRRYTESNRSPDRQLTEYMQQTEPEFPILHLRKTLLDAKTFYPDALYYRADTHWTPVGGYIGAREIIKHFNPDADLPGPGEFKVVPSGKNEPQDTGNQMLYKNKSVCYPEQKPQLPEFRGKIIEKAPGYIVSINPSAPDKRKLLIYRDSFAENMRPWLSGHFREIHYLWSRKVSATTIMEIRPDIFILEYVARQVGRMPGKL